MLTSDFSLRPWHYILSFSSQLFVYYYIIIKITLKIISFKLYFIFQHSLQINIAKVSIIIPANGNHSSWSSFFHPILYVVWETYVFTLIFNAPTVSVSFSQTGQNVQTSYIQQTCPAELHPFKGATCFGSSMTNFHLVSAFDSLKSQSSPYFTRKKGTKICYWINRVAIMCSSNWISKKPSLMKTCHLLSLLFTLIHRKMYRMQITFIPPTLWRSDQAGRNTLLKKIGTSHTKCWDSYESWFLRNE